MDSLTWAETQQDVPSPVTYQEAVDRCRAYIGRVRRERFKLAGTSQQSVTNVRTAPKQRAPRKTKGAVAPSRHSARQIAPAGNTVDSEAADKLFFSSIMSAPPSSAKPSQTPAKTSAKEPTPEPTVAEVLQSQGGSAITKDTFQQIVEQLEQLGRFQSGFCCFDPSFLRAVLLDLCCYLSC